MTPMRELEQLLRRAYPGMSIEYDPPLQVTGPHYMLLRTAPPVAVRWLESVGFWIADPFDREGAFDAVKHTEHATPAEACDQIRRLVAAPASAAVR